MTPDICYCFDDADLREAARIMEENQIRRLPVLNRNKRLIGIISLGDMGLRSRNRPLARPSVSMWAESGRAEQ